MTDAARSLDELAADRRAVEPRAREQHLGARHQLDRRLAVAEHLVLVDPLDQDRESAPPKRRNHLRAGDYAIEQNVSISNKGSQEQRHGSLR